MTSASAASCAPAFVPDVFQMTDAGVAQARSGPVDEDQLPLAQEARDQCPAQAIEAR